MPPAAIESDILDQIRSRLAAIEADQEVRILFAVESGSRAWGFPSPDSDFDVRFVYVRPRDWYLSIEPRRHVIEMPIEGLFDVNGWDLKKALQLLIKPNPVLLEWLESPIFYRKDESVVTALRALADKTLHHVPATHHYLHLGEGQWRKYIDGRERVSLKKYFYVLRPALALRWLRLHSGRRPPMDMAALRAGTGLPADVETFIDGLLERKRVSKEIGRGARIPAMDMLIEQEFAAARTQQAGRDPERTDLVAEANRLFRDVAGQPI